MPEFHVTVRQSERRLRRYEERAKTDLFGEIHFIGIRARTQEDAKRKAVKMAKSIGLRVAVARAERAL